MKIKIKYLIVIVVLALLSIVGYSITGLFVESGFEEDRFGKCLTDKGAAFYGAFWCSACAKQKQLLGNSLKDVNYVECDPRGVGANPALCYQKEIRVYPTWEINGQFHEGVQSLQKLSDLTGCKLS